MTRPHLLVRNYRVLHLWLRGVPPKQIALSLKLPVRIVYHAMKQAQEPQPKDFREFLRQFC